jgi:hypothetical protein
MVIVSLIILQWCTNYRGYTALNDHCLETYKKKQTGHRRASNYLHWLKVSVTYHILVNVIFLRNIILLCCSSVMLN